MQDKYNAMQINGHPYAKINGNHNTIVVQNNTD